jgi:hypothetical protein
MDHRITNPLAYEVSRAFVPPCHRRMSPFGRRLSDQRLHPIHDRMQETGTLAANSAKRLLRFCARWEARLCGKYVHITNIVSSGRTYSGQRKKRTRSTAKARFCRIAAGRMATASLYVVGVCVNRIGAESCIGRFSHRAARMASCVADSGVRS